MGEFVGTIGEITVDTAKAVLISQGIPVDTNIDLVASPIVKYLVKRGFDKVIKDIVSRQLSEMQKARVNEVRDFAISTFYKLAVENGWEDHSSEGDAYTQSVAESIEDVFNRAVNESRRAKRILLGALLGSTMYYSNSPQPDMENFFYISTIIDRLTFRQLCLVKMIGNKFQDIKGGNHDLCITNKVSISELSDLKSQDLWQPIFGHLGGPKENEHPIPLDYIIPTKTTKNLAPAIIFPDEIKDDFNRVVESLGIKTINPSDFPDSFINSLKDAINRNNNQ